MPGLETLEAFLMALCTTDRMDVFDVLRDDQNDEEFEVDVFSAVPRVLEDPLLPRLERDVVSQPNLLSRALTRGRHTAWNWEETQLTLAIICELISWCCQEWVN